jgi:hypothetical protein
MVDAILRCAPLFDAQPITWKQRSFRVRCCGEKHRVVLGPTGLVSLPDHEDRHTALAAIGNVRNRCLSKQSQVYGCLGSQAWDDDERNRGAGIMTGRSVSVARFNEAISQVSRNASVELLRKQRFQGAFRETVAIWSRRRQDSDDRCAAPEVAFANDPIGLLRQRRFENVALPPRRIRRDGPICDDSREYQLHNGCETPQVAFADDPTSLDLCHQASFTARKQAAELARMVACLAFSVSPPYIIVLAMSDADGAVRLCQTRASGSSVGEHPAALAGSIVDKDTGRIFLSDPRTALWAMVRSAERRGAAYPQGQGLCWDRIPAAYFAPLMAR